MCKYINFNNLRKKKGFVGEGEGGAHLCENTKRSQKNTKRRKRKHKK